MKITLKKVKTFRGNDGIGLDCDLYVDGKKVAHVFDDARGGEVDFHPYGKTLEEIKANRKILEDLKAYAKTLPERTYPASLGGGTYKQDLESMINDLLADAEKDKLMKKTAKKFATHIVIEIENGEAHRELSYGKPVRLLSSIPKERLQADIDKIKANLKAGERILNTNLTALGINV